MTAPPTRRAVSRFKVVEWIDRPRDGTEKAGEAGAAGVGEAGVGESGAAAPASEVPHLGAALVTKRYDGDLEGDGYAFLLTCREGAEGPPVNAGYVASEQVVGTLDGREGAFVIHHWGVAEEGEEPRTGGFVVPGSGTGALAGLAGEAKIRVDSDGTHTLTLDYEIG